MAPIGLVPSFCFSFLCIQEVTHLAILWSFLRFEVVVLQTGKHSAPHSVLIRLFQWNWPGHSDCGIWFQYVNLSCAMVHYGTRTNKDMQILWQEFSVESVLSFLTRKCIADRVLVHLLEENVAFFCRCGALHVGNRLLSINGYSLASCSLPEAVQMLLKSEKVVRLEVISGEMSASEVMTDTAEEDALYDPELPSPPAELLTEHSMLLKELLFQKRKGVCWL